MSPTYQTSWSTISAADVGSPMIVMLLLLLSGLDEYSESVCSRTYKVKT